MEKPIVEITQGKVLGTISQTINGNFFYNFRGIPYAKPPLGKLRFKSPQPPVPWTGIFDATNNGNCCFSKDLFKNQLIGSEDCLNLNVYTPSLLHNGKQLLPVMFWIHGGGFVSGSNNSNIYGPEFLLTENIVLVSINYRLGLLGFLSLDDPAAGVPGNAGFKDMVMALKWVKANIKQFNGDPDNVTVFGESAGGAAVHLLMLSPMAQGLLHKAISQSGCALNPWSRARKADADVYTVFECKGMNDIDLLEHLQSLPVETLIQKQAQLNYVRNIQAVLEKSGKLNLYGLVIERQSDEQDEFPFMSEDPVDIISSKKYTSIPFIVGYTKLEGITVETYSSKRVLHMLKHFEMNVPHFLGYEIGSEKHKMVSERIRHFYYGNEKPNEHHRSQLYEMVGDVAFIHGIYTSVKMHAMSSDTPVYFYIMSIKTSLKFLQTLMKQDIPVKEASHGDDVAYLFKTVFTPPLSPYSAEYNFIKIFVKLWTNFAYYGNPTPNSLPVAWKKANQQIGFLDIDKKLMFNDTFDYKNVKFWDKLFANSPSGHKFHSPSSKI